MEAITYLSLLAVVMKLVAFVKQVINQKWNDALTQLLVWVAAIGVFALAANASVTAGLEIFPGQALGGLDTGSILLAGLMAGSAASKVYDFQKARDASDSAAEPPLTTLS